MSGHQQADNQRFDIERARIPQLADDLRRRWGSIDVAPDIRDRLCAKHMRKHVEQNDEPSGGPWDVVIGMRSDGHMVQTAPELRDSWSCGEKVVDAELKKKLGSLWWSGVLCASRNTGAVGHRAAIPPIDQSASQLQGGVGWSGRLDHVTRLSLERQTPAPYPDSVARPGAFVKGRCCSLQQSSSGSSSFHHLPRIPLLYSREHDHPSDK